MVWMATRKKIIELAARLKPENSIRISTKNYHITHQY